MGLHLYDFDIWYTVWYICGLQLVYNSFAILQTSCKRVLECMYQRGCIICKTDDSYVVCTLSRCICIRYDAWMEFKAQRAMSSWQDRDVDERDVGEAKTDDKQDKASIGNEAKTDSDDDDMAKDGKVQARVGIDVLKCTHMSYMYMWLNKLHTYSYIDSWYGVQCSKHNSCTTHLQFVCNCVNEL